MPSDALGADWPTYHAVPARTGAAEHGPPLGRVRRLWSAPVDGAVYGEPLVVGGRVIVATENDSVYAFDATTGAQRWRIHLATPVSGGSLPCGDIDPSGITSTPVADPGTGALYVVTYESGFRHVLVALDLSNGAVRWQRPIDPPGGDDKTEQQRAALALANGRVYVSYGGLFGDCGRYHGWVVGVSASGPTGPMVSYQVPSQNEGAIWAVSGHAVDDAGNLYVATGNGNSSSFDYGNAVIRLTPALRQDSFFGPPDAGALNASDADLGSTGPVLLPGSRVFIVGKSKVAYLLDANHLGGIGNGLASINIGSEAFGGTAYAAGTVYVPARDGIFALRARSSSLSLLWHQGAASQSPIVAGPGVWAIGNGVLYQLDPATGTVRYSAPIGQNAHFATPTASGGRIYVAAGSRAQAFG
ncbi:MAG: PQQ-binding-like beta-propeller repeat protein [Solirubrobacterales bacterium]|nr:PQQ-binding-like beta-propeller repeat protein [Solirubrobacterales bacterium]